MNKSHRHRLIARLVSGSLIRNQEQLRDLLAASGVQATQGTLSRDLRELGVLKSPEGYTLLHNGDARRSASDLDAALQQHLLSAEAAASLVVLKTEAGAASAVAAQLDLAPPPGTVGTVAGDDTIFLAARSAREARTITLHLQKLGGIL